MNNETLENLSIFYDLLMETNAKYNNSRWILILLFIIIILILFIIYLVYTSKNNDNKYDEKRIPSQLMYYNYPLLNYRPPMNYFTPMYDESRLMYY